MTRALATLTALAALAAGCANLDSFMFNNERVDEYHFDEIDPQLDGELTDPHPSLIGPDDRFEGFATTPDGRAVHYVYTRRAGATDTIFYSHGNRKHLGRYWDRVELLWGLGYNVMIYDYPGYGRSPGTPTEQGVYENAAAALELLPTLPGVDPDRVWFYGYSLGGAPTFELAARAERGDALAPRGVLTESAFCSVEALVQGSSALDIPASYMSSLEFDNCGKARSVTVPVLLLHGADDTFVAPRNALMLRDASPTARLILVDGATHNDIPLVFDDYEREVVDHFQMP